MNHVELTLRELEIIEGTVRAHAITFSPNYKQACDLLLGALARSPLSFEGVDDADDRPIDESLGDQDVGDRED
jgi:hypothetical protein